MTQLTLQMPESAFAPLRPAPNEFAQEMRVAAAVKWYELGRASQGRAAEVLLCGFRPARLLNRTSA